ncbi:MAG: TolB family protein [Tepidisphaeraceae bacterium]
MTHRKLITGILSAGALAAMTVLPGCAGDTVTIEPPAANKPPVPTANPAPQEPVITPVANVFGELPDVATDPRGGATEFGFQQHTFVDEGYDAEPNVSADGRDIVFSSTRNSETTDIYMQHTNGQAVTQLTSDVADDAFPCFSPDGQKIAFASNRSGSWDIYTMDRTGKNITQITSGPTHDMHPSFSPDGTRIAYCSLNGRGQWELWIVNLQTSERRQIGYGLFPNWSPDKSHDVIAFQRARNRGGRWFSVWTCDLVDGEARSITEVAVSTNAAAVSPSWSPDGSKLAFATIVSPNAVDAHGKSTGQQDIWTINADGTGRHRLTDGRGINTSPFWAKDGRIYFVSDRSGKECVWSVNAGASTKPIATAVMPQY